MNHDPEGTPARNHGGRFDTCGVAAAVGSAVGAITEGTAAAGIGNCTGCGAGATGAGAGCAPIVGADGVGTAAGVAGAAAWRWAPKPRGNFGRPCELRHLLY